MDTNQTPAVRELWARAFNHVRDTIEIATVWLAMQAAVPIAVDGHYFVVGLAQDDQYLASNLQSSQTTATIEESLRAQTGRVLALQIIEGTTLEEWQAQKPAVTGQPAPAPSAAPSPAPISPPPLRPAAALPDTARPAAPPLASASRPAAAFAASAPDPSPTWEKLNERLALAYKAAPVKHSQGQARFVLQAARLISDTMDALLPPPGLPTDDTGERALAKSLERLGSIINLDPLFLALEVMRYRQAQGREAF